MGFWVRQHSRKTLCQPGPSAGRGQKITHIHRSSSSQCPLALLDGDGDGGGCRQLSDYIKSLKHKHVSRRIPELKRLSKRGKSSKLSNSYAHPTRGRC